MSKGVQQAAQPCSGAVASFPLPLPKRISLTNVGIVGGGVEDPECTGSYESRRHQPVISASTPATRSATTCVDEAEVQNISLNAKAS